MLLSPGEQPPFCTYNVNAQTQDARLVLICEHAGFAFPTSLADFGLSQDERYRHFVGDIAALDLAKSLASALKAPLLYQRYSRLLVDCNRRPGVESYIPVTGEEITIQSNMNLDPDEISERRNEIWDPFHDNVSAFLDDRDARGVTTAIISIHSFTPTFFGEARTVKCGVLCNEERQLSNLLLDKLSASLGETVQMNQPYKMTHESDYTIPVHGEDRGYHCSEIEVRNDLIATPESLAQWCEALAISISDSLDELWGLQEKSAGQAEA